MMKLIMSKKGTLVKFAGRKNNECFATSQDLNFVFLNISEGTNC